MASVELPHLRSRDLATDTLFIRSQDMVDRPNAWRSGWPTVRAAKEKDASNIAGLWSDVFVRELGVARPAWSESDVREAAVAGDVFVAEREKRVIGAVALVPHGVPLASITRAQESQLLWLAVERSARGSGVAGALMDQCRKCARHRGDTAIVLWTRCSMSAAQSLYKSLGYVRTPERDSVPRRGRQLTYRLGL